LQFNISPVQDHLELLAGGRWVPLSYVREGQEVYLAATDPAALWPSDALRKGDVSLRIGEEEVYGSAELITSAAEKARVLSAFKEKYGDALFSKWFAHPGRVLRIVIGAKSADSGYFRWLEQEFDAVADDYDMHITGNSINMLLRNRSLAFMGKVFKANSHLLEIGCGSGMETMTMLSRGHEILALDISSRMLEIVKEKAEKMGLSSNLRVMKLKASEINSLLPIYGKGAFDGAYSTYGALNCEPSLSSIPPALHALLNENGSFVAGVYNRFCLFEMIAYAATLNFVRLSGRFSTPVRQGLSRFCVDVYSYSLPEFISLFHPYFRRGSVEGVPVLLPPSDFDKYLRRFRRNFGILEKMDAWAGRRSLFRSLGDHFLLQLIRN